MLALWTRLSIATGFEKSLFELAQDLTVMLAGLLIASHSQIDALGFDLVEESEDRVASHDLPIEVVRFECLKLSVAIVTIYNNLFIATKLRELWCVDVPRWGQLVLSIA